MDERIDIEVIDKVAKTIKPELLGISQAAKNAHMQIAKLKRELGVGGGAGGMASATRAVAAAERDATKASAERARQARATASAIDAERAANERLRAVAARAASRGVTPGSGANLGGQAGSRSEYAAATEQMRQMSRVQDTVAASTARVGNEAAKTATKIGTVGKQAQIGRHHLLNLGFQLQDIFVSLASGQKPLTVFIQQGGQIGQIAAQSGVGMGALARAAGSILLRFAPLALAAGGVAGGFALINQQANKDDPIKKYANTLGLTRKEMKKLENVTITTGDTLQAVWNVTLRNIAARIGIDTKAISKTWYRFLDGFFKYAKIIAANVYASFAGMAYGINNIVQNLGDGKSNDNPLENLARGYREAKQDAMDFFTDVGKEQERLAKEGVKAQADAIKADRTAKANRKGPQGVDRAKELRDINRELAVELHLLGMVGPAREVEARWLDIKNGLLEKGIVLNAKEVKTIKDQIVAIQELIPINEQMQAIYEAVEGPIVKYQAALEAANRMQKEYAQSGKDSAQAQAVINRYLAEAELEWKRATDPLYDYNKAIKDQIELQKYYGRELEVQTEIQRRYNEMKALDPSLNIDRNALGRDVRSDMQRAGVQSFLGSVDSAANDNFREGGNQWIIDNYKTLYAELDRMRNGDLQREDEVSRAKAELDKRYRDARLSGTEIMLSNLTALQNAQSREVAAIGKAAAVAQATIDGIRAVQAALAGPPGPPWSFGIAATAGVAAAANVAKIMGVGFMKGGYTGDMPTNAVAGAVHGREYVMDAAATARIGVPALEALRNGRLNPGPAANNNGAKVTVINNGSDEVTVHERSDGELMIMIDRRLENKFDKTMQRKMSDPNSGASQAVGSNFKVQRKR